MSKRVYEPAPQGSEVVWLDDTESGRAAPGRERVLSIGNVAQMLGVSKLTLRYYEFRGLVHRNQVMDGQRVYGWADFERITFITRCRRAGITLSELLPIIAATDEEASLDAFKRGQEECMALVDRLERTRRHIDEALSELGHVYALLTSRLFGPNGASRSG